MFAKPSKTVKDLSNELLSQRQTMVARGREEFAAFRKTLGSSTAARALQFSSEPNGRKAFVSQQGDAVDAPVQGLDIFRIDAVSTRIPNPNIG